MQRNSFIQVTKLTNVVGRKGYIVSEEKQEYLYATYDTADDTFWHDLAEVNRAEFKKNGTNGKCIEARELIIALPESFVKYDCDALLRHFTDRFKKKYNVECSSALHHNKRKTNYHIHLIFSERRMLEEPIEKIATRNMFYDETGKHVRTKKEILDEYGNVRQRCRIVKKGEVYERIRFDKKDVRFKQDSFLPELKAFITDEINMLVKNSDERLKVIDRNGPYLPMKKVGKNNPMADEIQKDNAERTRWNKTVDQALVSDISEKEILEIKKEHITKPVKESIERLGNEPILFRVILGGAISVLEKLIMKVKEAVIKGTELIKEELAEKVDKVVEKAVARVVEKTVTKTEEIIENKRQEEPEPKPKRRTVELIKEPEMPSKPVTNYDIKKLLAIYDILKGKNDEIYAAQKKRSDKLLEYDNVSKLNFVKRSSLTVELQNLDRAIEEMQGELSDTVKKYGFATVQEFMRVLRTVQNAVTDYQSEMKSWEEKSSVIKKTNDMILAGDITIDFATELLEQKGYKVQRVQKDISDISKDSSIFGKLSRAKQRADENNQNREDKRYVRDKKHIR